MTDLSPLFLSMNSTIADAIRCIDSNALGIALIVDEEHHLLGTVVDGDIRRAILAQIDVRSPIRVVLENKPERYRRPVTAHVKTNRQIIIEMMKERYVRHVPLLNDAGEVVDIFHIRDLLEAESSTPALQAVVMAGGFGTRLRPLTEDLPKPMLPVGGRPLLEHVIRQLRKAGIRHINVTTHYMPEKIEDYFGDGSAFDVDINYVNEVQPLGTAGGITLLEAPDTPLLVMNGDLLTDVNFEEMYNYHREQNAVLTVAVRKYEVSVPYGVVESDGGFVERLVEKPSYRFFVNAGIYLLEPKAVQMLPKGKQVHMTDLIDNLIAASYPVASFPLREYWLDIGQPTDYERAQEDVKDGKVKS